ncbi:MAG: dTMP kinase [Acidobacteria bacterium]|nr:dTMP kinase [Acidobacteriota bacterium]
MSQLRPVQHRGLFITFEGIEGSGKSTQMARTAEILRKRGLPVVSTREPGGTPLGLQLRRLLLEVDGVMDPRTELLLMVADRRQHLTESIEPALSRGQIVLCDRYSDASRAYQGGGRKLGEDLVDILHEHLCPLSPDRTILLDCPPDVALARVLARNAGDRDRMEREDLEFHERVRASYKKLARKESSRFLVIDGTQDPDSISSEILSEIENLIPVFQKRSQK